ncbi:PREDICTED: uncharacterized protein LOC108617024 [Drosophila arizonae]|uniref:Uncharacterized protein LOC108617024 n=1 Tax=Drosophila arizonae TaxID=7263 RepID=A0ABM1PLP3_DROAR|nr:PREDICTED: uncharacterized protein LOC108617024 [Drosophila arizonae]
MWSSKNIVVFVLLGYGSIAYGQTIDCQKPPPLLDPALCCRDGGRDQIAEKCTEKVVGTANGQQNNGPPTLDTATCLADCILTTSQYKREPKSLNLEHIRNDLTAKFPNDTLYVEAMTAAFTKCEPEAQRRLAAIQQFNPKQPKCSPFSAIVLGCTYMEYFKNCPSHRWTQSPQCVMAKTFVTQCIIQNN